MRRSFTLRPTLPLLFALCACGGAQSAPSRSADAITSAEDSRTEGERTAGERIEHGAALSLARSHCPALLEATESAALFLRRCPTEQGRSCQGLRGEGWVALEDVDFGFGREENFRLKRIAVDLASCDYFVSETRGWNTAQFRAVDWGRSSNDAPVPEGWTPENVAGADCPEERIDERGSPEAASPEADSLNPRVDQGRHTDLSFLSTPSGCDDLAEPSVQLQPVLELPAGAPLAARPATIPEEWELPPPVWSCRAPTSTHPATSHPATGHPASGHPGQNRPAGPHGSDAPNPPALRGSATYFPERPIDRQGIQHLPPWLGVVDRQVLAVQSERRTLIVLDLRHRGGELGFALRPIDEQHVLVLLNQGETTLSLGVVNAAGKAAFVAAGDRFTDVPWATEPLEELSVQWQTVGDESVCTQTYRREGMLQAMGH